MPSAYTFTSDFLGTHTLYYIAITRLYNFLHSFSEAWGIRAQLHTFLSAHGCPLALKTGGCVAN